MDGAFQQTLYLHAPAALARRVGRETLIICGAARGMTSLPAFVLHQAGLFLGSRLGDGNYEDREIRDTLPPLAALRDRGLPLPDWFAGAPPGRGDWDPYLSCPEGQKLRRLISARNQAHRRWGFKLPRATDYIDLLDQTCRTPLFILCLRNPVATGRSIATRDRAAPAPLQKLEQSTALLLAMAALRDRGTPFIALDMDAVRYKPQIFLQEFCDLLRLDLDFDAVLQRISRPGYKRIKPDQALSA